MDIKAVSFKDVNLDGLKDIIIIASNIENSEYVATIYLQESDWTFRNDPNLDQEINDTGNNKDIKAVTDYLSQKLATGLSLSDSSINNTNTDMSSINKIQPASDKLSSLLEDDFVGEWNRTNTYMAYTGIITIKNLTDKSFDFSFNGFYGANSGTIDGTAVMTDRNKAEFKYVPEYDETVFAKVEFVFEKNSLLINLIEGDESALGFGHNVFIEGEYTKSEPIYLDANIINEILPTDEIKEKIRTLLGNDVYEQMVFVIEYGIRYQVDGLTYSGFISGAGEGVDLLINDNKIYCLGYGLDADGFVYKLYTNDQDYKDKLPPFMKIERPDYKLQFVYKP